MSKNLYSKYRFFALFRRACCYGAPGEKPHALPAGASRTDLRVCPHTTLLPHKKTGAHLREHRFNLHVMWSSQLARSHLHVMWSSDPHAPHPRAAAATCAYAKRSTPSLETRAKNSGSSSGALSPKTRASRKMRSPSSRRLSSPVRNVAITSPFST